MSSTLRLYQVDAFTKRVFGGNPAAVVPLERWLDDATLLAIAQENNLSETAFLVRRGDDWDLRWFTPAVEVDLCGHATLAAGWVVLNRLQLERSRVTFHSRSGPLTVWREGDRLALSLPARPPTPTQAPGLAEALGVEPREVHGARDLLALLESEAQVRALKPDLAKLAALPWFGVCVTAQGEQVDFVSRFFAPREGIPEDPVTGSAHCTLVPFWAQRLGKTTFEARQVSARGGELRCVLEGERVILSGHAALYLTGDLEGDFEGL